MGSRASSVTRTWAVLAWAGASTALAQNRVIDGGFAANLYSWTRVADDSGSSVWSDLDASGAPSSGSALLTSTSPTSGVAVKLLSQCVFVTAGSSYTVSARVLFTGAEPATGFAETIVYWQTGPCSAYLSGDALLTRKTTSGTWVSDTNTFTAPAGASSALVYLGIDKNEPGGTLSARFDDVVFAPAAGSSTETLVGYLAVAGSVPGAFGSHFKTSVQVLNPNFVPLTGRLVFHPAGVPAGPSDPSIGFTLRGGETTGWDDVVLAMGTSGIGSLDVYSQAGFPLVLARIFDDAGSNGTKGFTESMVSIADIPFPPTAQVTGYLLAPHDVSRSRFNIGVRTLGAPATLSVYVRDAHTNLRTSLVKNYPAGYFEQKPSAEFLDGLELGPDDSIQITFTGGGVIVYGATVDNTTNDPSAQFLPYLYWI